MYFDEVLRLRKEVASLKRQLGEKADSGNEDIFGETPVGAKEYEKLQAEHALLMRRQEADEKRQETRDQALRELEVAWDGENQRRAKERTRKRPDNSDIFVSEEEFRRTGGI